MLKLITFLLTVIEYQANLIKMFMVLTVMKAAKGKGDEAINKEYQKLSVDELPIFEKVLKGEYKHIIADHLTKTGETIKPIKKRKSSAVPKDLRCPYCNAPYEYIYDNNGGRGQFLCKVCTARFHKRDKALRDVVLKCPYCRSILQKVKHRKDFDIYKCQNDSCTFYAKNLRKMSKNEQEDFAVNPHKYKVRYIYRKFNIDFKPLAKGSKVTVLSKEIILLLAVSAAKSALFILLTFSPLTSTFSVLILLLIKMFLSLFLNLLLATICLPNGADSLLLVRILFKM